MRLAINKAARGSVAISVAIVLVSALLGSLVAWTAPGLERYTRDWLMRARGELAPPDDIVIVAIDERSIQRFGRFPWPRSVMARVVDRIAGAQPKAIALDILYTDPTTPEEDTALANSIAKAGNVVVAAQLTGDAGASAWLMPLPQLAKAAVSVGHVNVHTEAESVAREVPLRSADDAGNVLYAMPVEAIRTAERIPDSSITERPRSVIVGSREIQVNVSTPAAVLEEGNAQIVRAARILIDYIGPAGAFAPVTYSVADVLDGSVPEGRLRNKYVLIGATAASIGERFAAPFTHYTDVLGDQHGLLMPGVEVLANVLNTILRNRFYSETPALLSFIWAALVAALTIGLLSVAQGGRESLKQTLALLCVAAAIVVTSFLTFKHLLVYPPLTAQFVAFSSAGVLGLLRRSVAAGAQLDDAIRRMARANEQLLPSTPGDSAAESIARLTGARSVAVVKGNGRVVAAWGRSANEADVRQYPLGGDARLMLTGAIPSEDTERAAVEIARARLRYIEQPLVIDSSPRGVEARARALGQLNASMIDRWQFVDLAMRSVEDGLLITGPDARITFANRAAAEALRSSADALIGRNLLDRLAELEPSIESRELMTRLLVNRTPVEREIAVRGTRARRFVLRLAPVVASDGGVIGLVASLSDVTRQHQLQQTKNDVISLVSHEMRTPLTAIQGMTELLANYEMPPERRREMSLAINDEAKRLTRMITQYLDITRLESGKTVLRRSAVRIDALIDRTILLLEPLAAERDMSFQRDIALDLPVVLADPDLLSRAIENLVSNAIKYGAAGTPIRIAARVEDQSFLIDIEDQGAGIAPADIERIFDKFYRVPRAENADVPGTGLGLSLVREIAELHGGAITVRSDIGGGSVFTLNIPLTGPAM